MKCIFTLVPFGNAMKKLEDQKCLEVCCLVFMGRKYVSISRSATRYVVSLRKVITRTV